MVLFEPRSMINFLLPNTAPDKPFPFRIYKIMFRDKPNPRILQVRSVIARNKLLSFPSRFHLPLSNIFPLAAKSSKQI